MAEGGGRIELSENDFRLMRDLISDYCGIHFDSDSRYTMERRLTRRLSIHGIDNFRDYYRFLLYDKGRDDEMSEIIDVLTVNETYFFREDRQFKALVDEIVPELLQTRQEKRKLRIWSAGCASGEEPYSMAMLFLEHPVLMETLEVEIIGSDISRRVLTKARSGIYSKNSFRSIEPYYIRKYFTQEGDNFRIHDDVRKLVSFNYINLLDSRKQTIMGQMDVIFCRNVLIYFSQEAKKKAAKGFASRLVDGGYLLLGHAESLMSISTGFTLKHLRHDMVYQKPRKTKVSLSDEGLMNMLWGPDE